jgi:hypothetical protein
MVLIGTVMLLRTQRAQATASNQVSTAQSLDVAESGLTRALDFINTNSNLALYDYARWKTAASNDPTQSIPGLLSCANPNGATAVQQYAQSAADWTNLDANDPSKGQYKIIDYTYSGQQPTTATLANTPLGSGTLTVQGRTNGSTAFTNLRVSVPVFSGGFQGVPYPGLWLTASTTSGPSGNQTVSGNVFLNNCSGTANLATGTDPTTGQPWKVYRPSTSLPNLPAEPTGIIDLSTRLVGNNVSLTLPGSATATTTTPVPETCVQVNKNRTVCTEGGTVSTTVTVPDALSTLNGQPIYAYRIPSSLGKATITIPAGQKVAIWLYGNIDKNTEIIHECGSTTGCLPTDVQIYATGSAVTGGAVPSLCLNGNRQLEAFILAPNYAIGVAGGGNGGGFKGSLWAKSWGVQSCTSNSNHTVVVQTGNWAQLSNTLPASTLPPRIGPPTSWQRQAKQ